MPVAFQVRRLTPELMDDPAIPPRELDAALGGLARLNSWTRATNGLVRPMTELARKTPNRPLRILDVATGAGDIPIRLQRLLTAAGVKTEIDACDFHPVAVDYATRAGRRADCPVRFFVHDVLRDPLPGGYDAVTSSLFLHHLSDENAVLALGRMAAAGGVVFLTDLVRSRWTYLQVWLACHLLTWNRVNRYDGLVSVRAAFTPAEAKHLAERAGWADVTVTPRRPCRYLLTGRAG